MTLTTKPFALALAALTATLLWSATLAMPAVQAGAPLVATLA